MLTRRQTKAKSHFWTIFDYIIVYKLFRIIEYTHSYCKTVEIENKEDAHRQYFKRNARNRAMDCFILNLFEAFFESAPQIALQLFISFNSCDLDNISRGRYVIEDFFYQLQLSHLRKRPRQVTKTIIKVSTVPLFVVFRMVIYGL